MNITVQSGNAYSVVKLQKSQQIWKITLKQIIFLAYSLSAQNVIKCPKQELVLDFIWGLTSRIIKFAVWSFLQNKFFLILDESETLISSCYSKTMCKETGLSIWQCHQCDKSSKWKTQIKNHVESTHLSNVLQYSCTFCSHVTHTSAGLKMHTRRNHTNVWTIVTCFNKCKYI